MSLVMRMRQQGRKNKRTFRLVVADKRKPRDGKYIASVGHYNPHSEEGLVVHKELVEQWLKVGVIPSEKMITILKRKCPDVLKILEKGNK